MSASKTRARARRARAPAAEPAVRRLEGHRRTAAARRPPIRPGRAPHIERSELKNPVANARRGSFLTGSRCDGVAVVRIHPDDFIHHLRVCDAVDSDFGGESAVGWDVRGADFLAELTRKGGEYLLADLPRHRVGCGLTGDHETCRANLLGANRATDRAGTNGDRRGR